MKLVAERLKIARQSKGMSQMDVMRLTGINNKTLSGYENEVSEPDLDSLTKLANAYGTTIDYLAGRVASPTDSLLPERDATEEDFVSEISNPVLDEITANVSLMSPEEQETFRRLTQSVVTRTGKTGADAS